MQAAFSHELQALTARRPLATPMGTPAATTPPRWQTRDVPPVSQHKPSLHTSPPHASSAPTPIVQARLEKSGQEYFGVPV